MTEADKAVHLTALAEQDEIYLMWKHGYEDCTEAFQAFVNTQPDEIRSILWGYAACGRLMHQRLVNLACKYMEFPNNTEEGAV